ncbi:MAG: MoaD/ThiS family protein [Candidatus Geothermarchaeales archaeon]
MKVRVKVFASLRERLGWREREHDVEARDIKGLLEAVGGELYDTIMDKERGRLLPQYKVLLNGRDIDFLEGLKTELKPQDEILIFPPVGGG